MSSCQGIYWFESTHKCEINSNTKLALDCSRDKRFGPFQSLHKCWQDEKWRKQYDDALANIVRTIASGEADWGKNNVVGAQPLDN